jgi:hypothetical protein
VKLHIGQGSFPKKTGFLSGNNSPYCEYKDAQGLELVTMEFKKQDNPDFDTTFFVTATEGDQLEVKCTTKSLLGMKKSELIKCKTDPFKAEVGAPQVTNVGNASVCRASTTINT